MGTREFAQLNTTLLRSKKIKACNHAEKWAYMCVHLSPLSTFSGQFAYPVVMWAQDANLNSKQLRKTIERLVEIGLIEYDFDDEYVRIVGFHRQRAPDNASRVKSLVKDLCPSGKESDGRAQIRMRGIAE